MSDYTLQATWSTKDALATNQALKAISATELGTEFSAIATASATKYDSADLSSKEQAEGLTLDTVLITPHSLNDVLIDNGGIAKDLQQLANPGADTIFGWDNDVTAAIAYTLGEGITSTTTDIHLDLSEIGTVAIAAADTLIFRDVSGGVNGKTTVTLLEAGLQMANMVDYVADEFVAHSGVTLTAGAGMTGGGTIAASRTFNVIAGDGITVNADDVQVDISALSALNSETIAVADTFYVDDGGAGTGKKIAFQDMGPIVIESSSKTLAATDGNNMFVNTGAVEDTITIPLDAADDLNIGFQVGILCQGSAAVLVAAGGTTVESLDGNMQVKANGGGAYLIKTGANIWQLVGDLEA